MAAAQIGFVDGVALLSPLEAGAANEEGQTALMLAAAGNHPKCIKHLKAEFKKQDNKGWAAIHYACQEGHSGCV